MTGKLDLQVYHHEMIAQDTCATLPIKIYGAKWSEASWCVGRDCDNCVFNDYAKISILQKVEEIEPDVD